MLIFLVSIITIPIKYVSADSQWIGTITINTDYGNDLSQSMEYVYENGTFTFNVANGTIIGSGQETLSPTPNYQFSGCDPALASPTFSVKGTLPQNNTDFALRFTNFSQSSLTCHDFVGSRGYYDFTFVPNLLNEVIEMPAKNGTYNFTKTTITNDTQNIVVTINKNSNPTPEFGSVVPIVLVISILSIIILSIIILLVKTRFLH